VRRVACRAYRVGVNRRRAIVAIVAFASILVILFCRFREKKTHVATTSGVCPTPPIDRFSIGAGRFRVHRRSPSIPFRARRFRDRFLVSPTRGFSSCSPKADRRADGLLPEHVPVARWAGGCLRERHEEDWRVIVPPVILRSRARRGHSRARRRRSTTRTRQVRGEPPFAARPARGPPARKAFVVSTNSKRIVRHTEEGALHVGTSDIA